MHSQVSHHSQWLYRQVKSFLRSNNACLPCQAPQSCRPVHVDHACHDACTSVASAQCKARLGIELPARGVRWRCLPSDIVPIRSRTGRFGGQPSSTDFYHTGTIPYHTMPCQLTRPCVTVVHGQVMPPAHEKSGLGDAHRAWLWCVAIHLQPVNMNQVSSQLGRQVALHCVWKLTQSGAFIEYRFKLPDRECLTSPPDCFHVC